MANFIYKCRLCGMEYSNTSTGDDLAFNHLLKAIHGINPTNPQAPEMLSFHTHKNGDVGVSDFIGYAKETKKWMEQIQ